MELDSWDYPTRTIFPGGVLPPEETRVQAGKGGRAGRRGGGAQSTAVLGGV